MKIFVDFEDKRCKEKDGWLDVVIILYKVNVFVKKVCFNFEDSKFFND